MKKVGFSRALGGGGGGGRWSWSTGHDQIYQMLKNEARMAGHGMRLRLMGCVGRQGGSMKYRFVSGANYHHALQLINFVWGTRMDMRLEPQPSATLWRSCEQAAQHEMRPMRSCRCG